MARWTLRGLAVVVALGAGLLGCSSSPERSAKYRVAVVPKGTTHDFWKSIHAGAVQAARERPDVEILWDGPAKEDQRKEQQEIVERFTAERVSAIVLAPCDRQTLVGPVERALKAGIPVTIIDSGLDSTPAIRESVHYLGYVATNNQEGGEKAAERMIQVLNGKHRAKVLMIRYQAGSESTEKREAGFRQAIRRAGNVQFEEAADEAGATVDSAQQVAERLLSDRKDLDGVFAPNESSATGVLRALEVLHRTGQLRMVGFDSSEVLVEALRADKIQGLVVQDPFDMGYRSVLRAVDHLQGKPLPGDRTLYTNLRVLTKENMDDPALKPIYSRDLRPYLGD